MARIRLYERVSRVMTSCREVAGLVSEAPRGRVPWWRIDVYAHLLLCRHCRRFARQMRFLGLASRLCRDALEPKGADGEFEARVTRRLTGE